MAEKLQRALSGLATLSAGLGIGGWILSESLYNGEYKRAGLSQWSWRLIWSGCGLIDHVLCSSKTHGSVEGPCLRSRSNIS